MSSTCRSMISRCVNGAVREVDGLVGVIQYQYDITLRGLVDVIFRLRENRLVLGDRL